MNWSEVVRRLMEAGVTQMKIAELCGVSQSTISDLARGATKQPGYELGRTLEKLLDTLPAPAPAEASAGQGA